MTIRISNNVVATVAGIFVVVSLFSNFMIYKEVSLPVKFTGKLSANSFLEICINAQPTLNVSHCPKNVTAYYWYFCQVNASDIAGDRLTFYDNSPIFVIDGSTGTILFSPDNSAKGNQLANVSVQDNVSCPNSMATQTLNFTVIPNYPPNITSYIPNVTEYPKFPKINISKVSSLNFSVAFFDTEHERVSWEWIVNSKVKNRTINATRNTSRYRFWNNYTFPGIYNISFRIWDIFNLTRMINWTLNVTNRNRPPRFTKPLPHETWYKNQIKAAFYLNDYASDPDLEDTMVFNVTYLTGLHKITATIYPQSNNFVVFSQPPEWMGAERVYFTVTDNWGGFDKSNNITLSVVEPPRDFFPSAAPSEGGFGGGAVRCIEQWFCDRWGRCLSNGTMYRTCVDLNNCYTAKKKPATSSQCEYIPQCYNGVQDNGEEGIDCGGRCPACATCYDRIKNQGEEAIDCGGPCTPCQAQPEVEVPKQIAAQPIAVEMIKEEFLGKGFAWSLLTMLVLLAAFVIARPIIVNTYRKIAEKAKLAGMLAISTEEQAMVLEKTMSNLDSTESEIDKTPLKQSIKRLSQITREFFKVLFSLNYEFTYEELRNEMAARKIDPELQTSILSFFKRISEIEYGGYELSQFELRSLLNELRRIVTSAAGLYQKQLKQKQYYDIASMKGSEVFDMIMGAVKAINSNDLDTSKQLYRSIIGAYKKLPDNEKKKVYTPIKRLYDEIQQMVKKRESPSAQRTAPKVMPKMKYFIALICLAGLFSLLYYNQSILGYVTLQKQNIEQPIGAVNCSNEITLKAGDTKSYRIDFQDFSYVRKVDWCNFNNDIIVCNPATKDKGNHAIVIVSEKQGYQSCVIKINVQ